MTYSLKMRRCRYLLYNRCFGAAAVPFSLQCNTTAIQLCGSVFVTTILLLFLFLFFSLISQSYLTYFTAGVGLFNVWRHKPKPFPHNWRNCSSPENKFFGFVHTHSCLLCLLCTNFWGRGVSKNKGSSPERVKSIFSFFFFDINPKFNFFDSTD